MMYDFDIDCVPNICSIKYHSECMMSMRLLCTVIVKPNENKGNRKKDRKARSNTHTHTHKEDPNENLNREH